MYIFLQTNFLSVKRTPKQALSRNWNYSSRQIILVPILGNSALEDPLQSGIELISGWPVGANLPLFVYKFSSLVLSCKFAFGFPIRVCLWIRLGLFGI